MIMKVKDWSKTNHARYSYLAATPYNTDSVLSIIIIMAHVAFSPHPQFGFPKERPMSDSPAALGFGFTSSWNPSSFSHHHSPSITASPAARQQFASHMNSNVSVTRPNNKRRHEDEDDNDGRGVRDQSMDRSPTPERRRAAMPKRSRVEPSSSDKNGNASSKESKAEQQVDVGVLLGRLIPRGRPLIE